jgi:hypothetical protein
VPRRVERAAASDGVDRGWLRADVGERGLDAIEIGGGDGGGHGSLSSSSPDEAFRLFDCSCRSKRVSFRYASRRRPKRCQFEFEFGDPAFDFPDEKVIELACNSINKFQSSELQPLQRAGRNASFASDYLAGGGAFDAVSFRFPANQSIGHIRDV